ncbi:MAG: DUF6455 family protein [Arenibacterium sp.]
MQVLGERMTHLRLVCGMAKATQTDIVRAFDTGALSSQGWEDMVETCRACQSSDACQRWLAEAPKWEAPPGICLNRAEFAALKEEAAL